MDILDVNKLMKDFVL